MPRRRQVSAAAEERVDQRARVVAGRRVDDEAGRLVDDEQVVVLVHDVDGDLRLRDGRGGRSAAGFAAPASCRRRRSRSPLTGCPVDREPALRDEALDVAPREPAQVRRPAVGTGRARTGRDQHAAELLTLRPHVQASTAGSARQRRPEARREEQQDREADRGVGHVERVPAQVADPGVHEVDDVAEPDPIGQVAERAAEEQPERDREVVVPAARARGRGRSGRRRPSTPGRTAAPGPGTARTARPLLREWTSRIRSPRTSTDWPARGTTSATPSSAGRGRRQPPRGRGTAPVRSTATPRGLSPAPPNLAHAAARPVRDRAQGDRDRAR